MTTRRAPAPPTSSRRGEGARRRSAVEVVEGSTGLPLLGEVLLLGALLLPALFLVVPAVPGIAAGARHLRGHLEGRLVRVRDVPRAALVALRDLWPLALGLPAMTLVLVFNTWLAGTGQLPAGGIVVAVSAAVGAGASIVALRVAGRWEPGTGCAAAMRAAGRRAAADAPGSALLLAAVLLAAVLVWMLVALLLVVGGLLAFAAVSVEHRAVPVGDGPRSTYQREPNKRATG